MNSDIRISTDFPDHPKAIILINKLGFEAVWSLIRLWVFAAKHRPEGVLTGMAADAVRIACGYAGDIHEFLGVLKQPETRFLDADTAEGWIVLHDWKEHNPWAAGAKERSENSRKLAVTRWNAERRAKRNAGRMRSAYAPRNAPILTSPLLTKKESSPESLRLSGILADLILKNNPQHRDLSNGKRDTTILRWSADIDKLITIDQKPINQIERVIRFAHSSSFWTSNIMSGKKLREKYETLSMQLTADKTGKAGPAIPPYKQRPV